MAIYVPSTFEPTFKCEIDTQWNITNNINIKFPRSHEDHFIDFVGYDFIGHIRRIYSQGLVHSYIADDNENNTLIEITVLSTYSSWTEKYPIVPKYPVITYMNGNQCTCGELYSIGDKVKYYPVNGLTHMD